MLSKNLMVAAAMAGTVLVAGQARAGLVISGMTYKYADGTSPSQISTCCGPAGDPNNDDARIGVFGNGLLNNGKIGDQVYMDTLGNPRADGHTGQWWAYQTEGTPGDLSPGVYFDNNTTSMTIVFDLGASYNDLTNLRFDYNTQASIGGAASNPIMTVSDGVNPNVVFNSFPAPGDGPAGNGVYQFVDIDISSLSGQFITVTYDGNGDVLFWGNGVNEFTFSRVPEPASLALLGLGAAMILRRRRA